MQQIWSCIEFYLTLSTVTFFIYKLIVMWIIHRITQHDVPSNYGAATTPLADDNIPRVLSKWSLLIDCFYRSFNPLMDFELDENVESLFERLVLPNMWLTPAVPADYLKYLPVWRFECWTLNAEESSRLESLIAPECTSSSRRPSKDDKPPSNVKWIPSTDCAICLEKYCLTVDVCGLPCGHHFHHNCIMVWLLQDNHHCPICRWPAHQNKNVSIV